MDVKMGKIYTSRRREENLTKFLLTDLQRKKHIVRKRVFDKIIWFGQRIFI
jgi:hypothetical protein